MLKVKSIFQNTEFIKLYRIHFFSISAFTYDKQIEEKRTKKSKSLQVIKHKTKHHPTRLSD